MASDSITALGYVVRRREGGELRIRAFVHPMFSSTRGTEIQAAPPGLVEQAGRLARQEQDQILLVLARLATGQRVDATPISEVRIPIMVTPGGEAFPAAGPGEQLVGLSLSMSRRPAGFVAKRHVLSTMGLGDVELARAAAADTFSAVLARLASPGASSDQASRAQAEGTALGKRYSRPPNESITATLPLPVAGSRKP